MSLPVRGIDRFRKACGERISGRTTGADTVCRSPESDRTGFSGGKSPPEVSGSLSSKVKLMDDLELGNPSEEPLLGGPQEPDEQSPGGSTGQTLDRPNGDRTELSSNGADLFSSTPSPSATKRLPPEESEPAQVRPNWNQRQERLVPQRASEEAAGRRKKKAKMEGER